MRIRVLINGRSYHTADELPEYFELPKDTSLDAALDVIARHLRDSKLAGTSLIVRSGRHLGTVDAHDAVTLEDGDELMLIEPVAGG